MMIKRARKQTTRDDKSESIPIVSTPDLVTHKQTMMRNGKTVSLNELAPLFKQKTYDQLSVFIAANLHTGTDLFTLALIRLLGRERSEFSVTKTEKSSSD